MRKIWLCCTDMGVEKTKPAPVWDTCLRERQHPHSDGCLQLQWRWHFLRALILMVMTAVNFTGLLFKVFSRGVFRFLPWLWSAHLFFFFFWHGSYSKSLRVDSADSLRRCQCCWALGCWLVYGWVASGSDSLLLLTAASLLAASHDGERTLCIQSPTEGGCAYNSSGEDSQKNVTGKCLACLARLMRLASWTPR